MRTEVPVLEGTIESRQVETEIKRDLEPTAEIIGTMSELARGKWRGVDGPLFRF